MADPNDPKKVQELKELLNEVKNQYKALQKEAKTLSDIQEAGGNAEKTKNEALLQQIEVSEKLIEVEKEQLRIKYELNEFDQETYKKSLSKLETNKEYLKDTKKVADETERFGKSVASSFSSITGIGGQSKTLLGSMIQVAGKGGTFSDSLREAGQQIARNITVANVLAAVVDKIVEQTIELAKQQDKAYADFEKEVGNVQRYKDQIMDLRNENGYYGISVENAAKSFAGFKAQFAGFETLSKEQQNTLTETSARLGKLGVAESDVIKTQEMLVKGMGMTVKQSTDLQKSLYGTAIAMGLPIKQVAADFSSSAPQLAKHGKNMTSVFLDLQNTAKNTGIEFKNLISITEKFDTFEGAADSAGKLNAILGGDFLNSIDLLNASEGERVRLMQEALSASGKTFDSMSVQERKATAAALGISDLTELQKLMNNETTKGTVEAMNAEKAQAQMNEAIKDATELGEAFKNLMAKLAIEMRPVIEAIKSIVMGLTNFIDGSGSVIKIVLGVVGVIVVWKALMLAFNVVAALTTGVISSLATVFGTAGPVVAASSSSMAAGITAIGTAATVSSVGLLTLGATILMIGAGIGLIVASIGAAAAGFGLMAKSIGEMFASLSKSDPKNIALSFAAVFDSISITGLGKLAAFALAAYKVADSIEDINNNLTEMIAKMGTVNTLQFAPKVQTGSPITTTASTTAAAAATGTTGGSTTNIVPVAVYLDSKKIGEILDPRIKQTIQDSLKNIGSKTAAVGI
jgi:hypothetical protein